MSDGREPNDDAGHGRTGPGRHLERHVPLEVVRGDAALSDEELECVVGGLERSFVEYAALPHGPLRPTHDRSAQIRAR
jgi:hypothetical protein